MADLPYFEVLSEPATKLAAARSARSCFQNAAWVCAVAAARARPHTMVAVRAACPKGREAMLFGAVHRRFGMPVFEAMPMGGYGGWVGGLALGADEERELNRAWLQQVRWPVVVLTSEPGRAGTLPAPAACRGLPARLRERVAPRTFFTHRLDLAGDDAALLQRARPRMRSYLRQFDQLGFEFELRRDVVALAAMHSWYCRGSDAWQRPASALLPQSFFTSLAGGGEVWTVCHGGHEVGAALFLVGRNEVQYQASGAQRLDGPVSATEALLWAAARHYRARGLATLNLGASDGLASVGRFKEKFGATTVPYLRVTYLLPALRHPLAAAAVASNDDEAKL